MARILIGVSGGIAAYKAIELARLATLAGHGVRILMTENARRFVGAASFEGIVGAPVLGGEFERDPMQGRFPGEPASEAPSHDPISHLALAERADAYVIAPASANTIAKLATGICDSLLTTSFLGCPAPRLVVPAMNERMWDARITSANVAALREREIEVMEPAEGQLASRGEHGRGRMPEPPEILARVEALAARGVRHGAEPGAHGSPGSTTAPRMGGSPGGGGSAAGRATARQGSAPGGTGAGVASAGAAPLAGRRVLVTAGGTREAIDPVRFIGNRSSGRMGVALAEAALRRGAEVTLIAANVALPAGPGIERVDVESAAELAAAAERAFASCDVLFMAAAVADFRPTGPADGKLEREGSGGLRIELEETEDVLASLAARRRPGQTLVGFAAEHGGDYLARARGKLERKGIDAIVVNDVSDPEIGFDSGDNEVTIVTADDQTPLPRADKEQVAEAILDRLGTFTSG